MTIGTMLFTWLHGVQVGADRFGNRYFRERSAVPGRTARRWVVYKGRAEPSKVPAEWHAWLHYTVDAPIDPARMEGKPWVKEHLPNLTGTAGAYLPAGDDRRGGKPVRTYEAWRP